MDGQEDLYRAGIDVSQSCTDSKACVHGESLIEANPQAELNIEC